MACCNIKINGKKLGPFHFRSGGGGMKAKNKNVLAKFSIQPLPQDLKWDSDLVYPVWIFWHVSRDNCNISYVTLKPFYYRTPTYHL